MVRGNGPTFPVGPTPPSIGCSVPNTEPLGRVNQNETASPGVKPVPRNTIVSPTTPATGSALPFVVPVVSQVPVCAEALSNEARLSKSATNGNTSFMCLDNFLLLL